jgi:hypothetical protein
MRKIMCFCDRCAVAAEWTLRPWKQNFRYFELIVTCHGETERFLVATAELFHARDPSSGRETTKPLYVIAFEDETARSSVRVIESPPADLSIRLSNRTNRVVRE